ncbi:Uncharacterised protein [Legionella busanensis]|uniref:Uncharacterized protein n=1 Tax=Legionella busanensis TaxID=190655 RepID=A0A378JI78_9GAMM|nr:hypothetical protein [Legionella busanensis]STX50895.1 Uncharacterised protein [Legionella busanensis]
MINQTDISKYYLKQDPEQDKNICEVFASQIMRFIAEKIGEDPSIIANVSYLPLSFDKGLYIASELFQDYRDLYLDAYLAYQLPAYQELRRVVGDKFYTLPHHRPRYFEYDICIDTMTEAGRYKDLIPGLAKRGIIDDPDTHYKNIGAVPIKKSTDQELIPIFENARYIGYCIKKAIPQDYPLNEIEEISINHIKYYKFKLARQPDIDEYSEAFIIHNKNYYLIPNIGNTRAVQIDFGGALGDFRLFGQRKFDERIHLKSFHNLFRYHPSYSGPPAYHDQISDALTYSATYFFETLARYSMIDRGELTEFINQQIDIAVACYKNQPQIILDFAHRIGLNNSETNLTNLDLLSHQIKQFLQENFISRQEHAKLLFLRHFCQLDYTAQITLMTSYELPEQNAKLKDKLIRMFFQNLKEANPSFFTTLKSIQQLNLSNAYYNESDLLKLKLLLHQQLCKAYLKGRLENKAPGIQKIIEQTSDLLSEFVKTKSALNKLSMNDFQKADQLIKNFINTATQYKQTCITATTDQTIIMAACTLSGALVGAVLGAALGIFIGGLIFGPLTTMAGTAQGITMGIALGSAIISLLAGASTANKLTRYHLFKSMDKYTQNISDSLTSSICPESTAPCVC